MDDVVCLFCGERARLEPVATHLVKEVEPVDLVLGGGAEVFVVDLFVDIGMQQGLDRAHFNVANVCKHDTQKIMLKAFEFLWEDKCH